MGDILIHGMEMPSMGYREIRIHPNGTVTERLDRCEVTVGKAVPVPEHGRLIDADATIRYFSVILDPVVAPKACGVIVGMSAIIPADDKEETE